MLIQRLVIQNFRNLSHIELDAVPGFNLICGPNGAGKTSVLEAINYLALGRSFRLSSNQYLIQQGQPSLSIFSKIQEDAGDQALQTTIGLSKSRGEELTIKINSDPLARLIDLIDHICVQVIHPQGIELITKDSEGRRSFIDWGVYYSDPVFKPLWLEYRKALKQRNALLRQNSTRYKSKPKYYLNSDIVYDGGGSDFRDNGLVMIENAASQEVGSQDQSIQLNSSGMLTERQSIVISQTEHQISDSSNSLNSSNIMDSIKLNNTSDSSGSFDGSNGSQGLDANGSLASDKQGGDAFDIDIHSLSPVLQAYLRAEAKKITDQSEALNKTFAQRKQLQRNTSYSDFPIFKGLGVDTDSFFKSAVDKPTLGAGADMGTQTLSNVQNVAIVPTMQANSQSNQAQGSVPASTQSQVQSSPFRNQAGTGQRFFLSPLSEFDIWNEQIADLSEKITERRLNYLKDLQVVLQSILNLFLPNFKLKFELYFGWEKGSDLRAQLAQNLEKERGLGYTLYGCHRADLKIKNRNLAAGATLSRGQLKMLVYALRLAQGMLLKQQTQRSCIYLIDDLNSELDDNSQRRLLNTLLECQHQVFISNIQSDFRNTLIPQGRSDVKVFKLEQGKLVIE